MKHFPEQNIICQCKHGNNFADCDQCEEIMHGISKKLDDALVLGDALIKKYSEPSKKRKKKPTGILKDLLELERYSTGFDSGPISNKEGAWIKWRNVEAIINKYLNP